MFSHLSVWEQQFLFSVSHANRALKSLIVHVSCHNRTSSSVHEKNGDHISTLRGFASWLVFFSLFIISPIGNIGICLHGVQLYHVKITRFDFKSSDTELIFKH